MSKWISVKDRLPGKSGDYLTLDMDMFHPFYQVLEYSAKYKLFNSSDDIKSPEHAVKYAARITYWMELPEPPEREGEDE